MVLVLEFGLVLEFCKRKNSSNGRPPKAAPSLATNQPVQHFTRSQKPFYCGIHHIASCDFSPPHWMGRREGEGGVSAPRRSQVNSPTSRPALHVGARSPPAQNRLLAGTPLSFSSHRRTLAPFPLPPLATPPSLHVIPCHSPQCNLAQRRAATALRNSVIYWQFPPQVSAILYLNTSAAPLNKTALSIYISVPQPGPGHIVRGTR